VCGACMNASVVMRCGVLMTVLVMLVLVMPVLVILFLVMLVLVSAPPHAHPSSQAHCTQKKQLKRNENTGLVACDACVCGKSLTASTTSG